MMIYKVGQDTLKGDSNKNTLTFPRKYTEQ